MALFIANATGNWSSTASWAAGRNTPTIHATASRTVSAGGIISLTFTAPNTTNAVTGVLIFVSGVGTGGTLVATLRESGIDTAATVSVPVTSLKTSAWMYLKLATPYTYTTTTAGAYAWKLAISGGSGTTQVADNSAASAFAFLSADDLVSAVPTTGDDVFIAGDNLSALTITVDDTSRLVGSGTGTGTPTVRNVNAAINLSHSGTLAWSNSANSTLEVKGQIEVATDGILQMGSVASPISSSYIAKLITNQNGTPSNYDLQSESAGRWIMQGASRTYWKTKYSSGAGTAASPLITADPVDWNVGDEICFTGQGAYNEHEKRFIITKNSTTSYVLSTTSGGGEVALTYTHDTDDRILLLTRNVIITSKTSTEEYCFVGKATTEDYIDIDWARFEYSGGALTSRRGIQLTVNGVAQVGSCDYSVNYLPDGWGFSDVTSTTSKTYTGLITYGNSTATNVGSIVTSGAKNKSYVDCFAVGNNALGFYFQGGSNISTTRCEAWNNNANNQLAGGLRIDNGFTHTHTDLVLQANRVRGAYLNATANCVFESVMAGNYGSNTIDLDFASDTYNEIIFRSAILGSATTVNNYLNIVPGSELKFERLTDTDWYHLWYTAYGTAHATGPDCPDTTTLQTGSHNVRLTPEDATVGQTWSFQILARAGYYVSAQGFVQMNSTFSGDAGASCTVSLFLPGSTSADATTTMTKDTNKNPFNIGATYSGTDDGLATVYVTAKSSTASAYVYVGQIFNGTNPLTAVDVWKDGKPSSILYPELGDPDSVWAVSTSGLTTVGTTGKKLVDDLTTGKFLALK